ncbi:hypothetical protein HDU79_003320 [Rhizoclosmatium sp. JEL0117]|nr:hypothetical protein HDU79_003320 [Rhizoclosmatium sp. JEL0117]
MDLLDDLDDLADDDIETTDHISSAAGASGRNANAALLGIEAEDDDAEGDDMDEVDDDDNGDIDDEMPDLSKIKNIGSVAQLMSSKRLIEIMQADNTGPVEEDPEYKVLVNANNLLFDVDSEILLVHKFIRDKYSFRFPELETIVPNALDYARVVKVIGNEVDIKKLDLESLLPKTLVMNITMASTKKTDTPLDPEALQVVFDACDMALDLETVKRTILDYVESRMQFLAPNLTAILGSTVAAKLMGAVGGLTALSKIAACNLLVVGKMGKSDTGLFAKGQVKHAGYIYYSEMVQMVPKDYRNKAARMLSAKCCLAARLDRAREAPDGNMGRIWRDDIAKKLDKAMEPPPGHAIKALPIPNDGPKKRRGGKRFRAMKEKMAMTEAWKQQNRMSFNTPEEEVLVGDTIEGLGMLGGQTGKLRTMAVDPKKKLKMAKKHRSYSGSTTGTASGLSSSLAFTPVQGIELENPEVLAQARAAMKDDNYFGGFKKKANPASK